MNSLSYNCYINAWLLSNQFFWMSFCVEANLQIFIPTFGPLTIILGLNTDQIHSVEMIGDATRTPIILDISKQIFGKTECLRTLNSLETVARGTAL